MTTSGKLSFPTILFHWSTAIIMIAVIAVGLYMGDMPRGPDKGEMIGLHKSLGVIAFVFAAVRLLWRKKEGAIPAIAEMPRWQEIVAKSVHHLLMLATILMPVSGIMMNTGGGRALNVFGLELIAAGDKIEWLGDLGGTLHHVTADVLLAVLALHVLAALKHEVIDKDGTIRRMLGKSVS